MSKCEHCGTENGDMKLFQSKIIRATMETVSENNLHEATEILVEVAAMIAARYTMGMSAEGIVEYCGNVGATFRKRFEDTAQGFHERQEAEVEPETKHAEAPMPQESEAVKEEVSEAPMSEEEEMRRMFEDNDWR